MNNRIAIPFDQKIIDKLPGINNPGMISDEEEKLYYYLACQYFDPSRFNLEVGTWLGRSTKRICQGFEQNASPNFQLVCYDSYQWSESYSKRAKEQSQKYKRRLDPVKNLKPNESFREAFLTYMGDFSPCIQAYAGRLGDISTVLSNVLIDKPVGLVFIDASKGWPENVNLLKFLAPKLVSGEQPSVMLFQDFFFFPAYKLIFLLSMIPQLKPFIYTKTSTSIVYRVNGEIDPEAPIFQPGFLNSLSEDDIYEAWKNLNLYIPRSRMNLLATHLALPIMLWERNFKSAAEQEFARASLSEHEKSFVASKVSDNSYLSKIKPLRQLLND
ncbi:class I SAM-dependent methyltransferase [Limnospira fusiformis KN01]|uniref:class I SAM-dependent methyltransferase n=1 Tax=Limnospira TaxID=2596745 RepID=UPI0016587802|nr:MULTISPECIES: class I SAM-dependent methyltransferase [Limnospira]MDT9198046.1 class I SAM-dependent methyltransferase [Limnospira sp. PMC 1042.18]ULB45193.1 class I SAM-dependent methyltransferase [Limnospira fusiformis KN01]